MCGVAGFWRTTGASAASLERNVAAMGNALRHRGPGSSGVWADADAGLAFAHRRLAIVELSPAGHQPMMSPSGRYVLTFNGEIYNHADLRRELEGFLGNTAWRGSSDTETLAAAIEAWGATTALTKCIGMFAFAVWDRRERSLHLARDRMGEKPLYYGWTDKGFVFASELKAVRAIDGVRLEVDRDVLGLYLQFGVVPAPYAIYHGLWKLMPGASLTITSEDFAQRKLPDTVPYWSIGECADRGLANPILQEEDALAQLEGALRDSVSLQRMADVPLGAFLSGGVDSSLIVALMQAQSPRPVKTFTVGFDESGFDESPHAAAVARHLGTDHQEIRVTVREALDVIPQLPEIYDEPFADSSQIPTYLVCAAARREVSTLR